MKNRDHYKMFPVYPNDPARDRLAYDIGREYYPKALARCGGKCVFSQTVSPEGAFRIYTSRLRDRAQFVASVNSLEKALEIQAEVLRRGWFIQGVPDYLRPKTVEKQELATA